MKRILLASTLIGLMLLWGVSSLSAQVSSASVSTINVDSLASVTVLSPDNHTLAVYNQYVIYNTAPTFDTLPVRLIDTQTGKTIATLSGYTDWVTGLAFNSDGSRIVTFHRNGDVNLWDVTNTARPIKTIQTFTIGGSSVQLLNDDKTILMRSGEFILALLDTDSGAITHLFGQHLDTYDEFSTTYSQYPGRGDIGFAGAAVSPDGQWLVASTQNDEVILWEIATGKQVTLRPKSDKFGQFSIRAFVFSKDSSQLTYFDQGDKKTHVWDIAKRAEIGAFDVGGASFALAPDGKQIAWADRTTKSIDLAALTTLATPVKLVALPDTLQVAPLITSLAFTRDGKQLIVGGLYAEDGKNQIYIINLAS